MIDEATNDIVALSATDGRAIWRVHMTEHASGLATSERLVLVLANRRIHAYSIADGNEEWASRDELPDRAGLRMAWDSPGRLYLYSNEGVEAGRDQVIRVYNLDDGELTATERIPEPGTDQVELRTEEFELWENGEEMWAVDSRSDAELWRVSIPGPIHYWPTFSGTELIISAGMPAQLLALNAVTGSVTWLYPGRLVSNAVVHGDGVYAMREDATIVALSRTTGREIASIAFDPPLRDQAGTVSAYWLAACNGTLYVYFGDTQELFAYSLDSAG